MQKTNIKSVDIKKTGRFWSVRTDKHKLLAVVLYKRGALAVQELLQELAGITAEEPAKAEKSAKGGKKSGRKAAAKTSTADNSMPASKSTATTATPQTI
jgi:hypothetical protein